MRGAIKSPRTRVGMALAGAVSALWVWAPALAQTQQPAERIFTCVDANGRRYSSDRPIPECLGQEQRVLGRDGSVRGVVPPLSSPDEQERQEELRKQKAQEQALQSEAVRRDRLLMTRYQNVAAHELAQTRALNPIQRLIDTAKNRLKTLDAEAKALAAEKAALGSKPMSEDLKQRISANEGVTEAQRSILTGQEAEKLRVVGQFAVERARLRQLWGGMAPGTDAAASEPRAGH